ncbi:MAG: TRAP transporter small permease [Lachnospiraceae bacterium]|nr:TRAP transporter small permease [Lachnospiraceae bacterium]
MNPFVSFVHKLARKLDIVSLISIMLMMFLVAANCIGRKFNLPIYGTYDLACFLLVLIAAPSLANCEVEGGHTKLDMLTSKFPFKTQRVLEIIISILSIAFCIVISASLWIRCLNHIHNGLTGSTVSIPVWPFILIELLSVILFTLVCVCNVIIAADSLKKGESNV